LPQLQLLDLARNALPLVGEEDAPKLRNDQFQRLDLVIAGEKLFLPWPSA
jgi:hypothetical protein